MKTHYDNSNVLEICRRLKLYGKTSKRKLYTKGHSRCVQIITIVHSDGRTHEKREPMFSSHNSLKRRK